MAQDVGSQIGNFLTNGLIMPFNNLLGTTTETETPSDAESKADMKRTGLIVISVLGVIVLIVIGYFIIKSNKQN